MSVLFCRDQMYRPILVGVVVLSLCFAGCNGISFGSETPTETLTPAAVPTDEPTPTPVPQLAPGLTEGGVTNPFALAGAHTTALNDTSYVFHENTTVRYVNGTIADSSMIRTAFEATTNRFHIVQNETSSIGSRNVSLWSNGEGILVAQTSNDTTSYNVLRNTENDARRFLSFGTSDERIGRLFSAVETRVTDRERRNGTTLYRVEATDITNRGVFENEWQNPRNITLVAYIGSQGLVREYHVTYAATLDGAPVRVERHVRYTAIGNTTVERPPWYDAAIERATPQET